MQEERVLQFDLTRRRPLSNGRPASYGIAAADTDVAHTEGSSDQRGKQHQPEKILRLISPRNLDLLRMIRTQKPRTLAELSRMSGRPKASLTRTLARLADLGIVVLARSKGRGKIPQLACDRLRLDVDLSVEDGTST